MFFALKSAFWLGLVFWMLAGGPDARSLGGVANTAGTAVAGLCAANARACLTAAERMMAAQPPAPRNAPSATNDTLRASDRTPAWRGQRNATAQLRHQS